MAISLYRMMDAIAAHQPERIDTIDTLSRQVLPQTMGFPEFFCGGGTLDLPRGVLVNIARKQRRMTGGRSPKREWCGHAKKITRRYIAFDVHVESLCRLAAQDLRF